MTVGLGFTHRIATGCMMSWSGADLIRSTTLQNTQFTSLLWSLSGFILRGVYHLDEQADLSASIR
jgi:hypothetical protein